MSLRIPVARSIAVLPLLLAGAAGAATHEVVVSNALGFFPTDLRIQPGDTVRWVNQGGEHNVQADDGTFGNSLGRGWTYEHRFDTAGTFPYFCVLHGGANQQGMAGIIRVQAVAPPPPPPEPAFVINEGVSGSWYNPATSGQGLLMEASGSVGVLTLAWFTWGEEGGYDWLTGAGPFDGDSAVLDLVRSSGGRFNNPAPVQSAVVGSALLSFTGCGEATFTYTLQDPPSSGVIPLQRILPAPAACLEANPATGDAD